MFGWRFMKEEHKIIIELMRKDQTTIKNFMTGKISRDEFMDRIAMVQSDFRKIFNIDTHG